MKVTRHNLIILLLIPLLFGCTSTPTPSYAPRSAWITKFLEEPTCQLPCWENIVPGEMTMDETFAVLSNNPNIQIRQYWKEPIDGIKRQEINWDFAQTKDGGLAWSDHNGEVLQTIKLGLSKEQLLTIQEVINTYGFPTKVYLSDCRDARFCFVEFVYVEFGMSASTDGLGYKYHKSRGYRVTISEETRIEVIYLHPAGEQYYRAYLGAWADYDTIPNWNGYGEYTQKVPFP
jgi:hypothetical protein